MGRVEGSQKTASAGRGIGGFQPAATYHDKKLGVGKVVLSRVTKGNVSTQQRAPLFKK